ncbi:MAG: HD-GYP domain-containing protein [Phycisphaera sp.]|nr:HD-GYP domain-containing protein [Phycisphaera sp.]
MNTTHNRTGEAMDLVMAGELECIGATWIPVVDGLPRWPEAEGPVANWRSRLLADSRPVRAAAERHQEEILAGGGGVVEVMSGVWAIGCSIPENQGQDAGFAMMISKELFEIGSLSMLCGAARLDETLVRDLAASVDLPSGDSAQSLAALVRRLHRVAIDRVRDRDSQASVDRRLSESYEELHLLNSLIDGLVLGGDADDFLRKACVELAATAGYRWIALLVDSAGSSVADDHVLHGEGIPTRTELRRIADQSGNAVATSIDTGDHGEVGVAAIRGGGRSLGTLLAGGRAGEPIGSVELTLLASAAGHVGVFLRNAMLYADLDAMFLGTLQSMVAAIDAKDPYTRGHSQRVALLSRDLAASIGLPDSFVRTAHLAGLVHDIGKIGVPEAVLCKAGRLDDEEFALIRQHPQTGHRILKDIPQIRDLLPGVLCHHEAWNGSGYPAGLAGEEIPLLARIVAICDSFDAMSSSRTYRKAMPRTKVFEEIRSCGGRLYDPRIVPVFLGMDLTEYDRLLERDAPISATAGLEGLDKSKGLETPRRAA